MLYDMMFGIVGIIIITVIIYGVNSIGINMVISYTNDMLVSSSIRVIMLWVNIIIILLGFIFIAWCTLKILNNITTILKNLYASQLLYKYTIDELKAKDNNIIDALYKLDAIAANLITGSGESIMHLNYYLHDKDNILNTAHGGVSINNILNNNKTKSIFIKWVNDTILVLLAEHKMITKVIKKKETLSVSVVTDS